MTTTRSAPRSAESTTAPREHLDPLPADWRRPVTPHDRRTDALIAAVLLVGGCVTTPLFVTATAPLPPLWLVACWLVLLTGPLALRRRYPTAVAVIVVAAFVGGQAAAIPENLVSQIAPFVALYTVGAWEGDRRRSVVARIGLVAGLLALLAVGLLRRPGPLVAVRTDLPFTALATLSVLANLLYLAGVLAFGEGAWRSARRLAGLRVRTAQLQTERERTAAQAVTLERLRIARELHDVVAHHVSVIGIHAGAARRVLRADPERAVAVLSTIERTARTAVDELRRTLVTLRSGDDGDPEPAPGEAASTLGVDQIPDLVAESARSGTRTVLMVIGQRRTLPPVTDLVLYRVAQEALTNVRKHAGPGALAAVRLHYQDESVDLEVENEGRTTPSGTNDGLGRLGMRERVTAVGGTVESGPTESGYAVRASVPAPPAEDA